MTITFFGHSVIDDETRVQAALYVELEKLFLGAGAEKLTFYCGFYGAFDRLAAYVIKRLKKKYRDVKAELLLITPYVNIAHNKNLSEDAKECDGVIYPGIENVPLQYAIARRNKWMADNCDLVISYITHTWGGAYKSCEYARRIKKKIIYL